MKNTLFVAGLIFITQVSCKSRFFSFGGAPEAQPTQTSREAGPGGQQIPLNPKDNDNMLGKQRQELNTQQSAPIKPLLNGIRKTVPLNQTTVFELDGRRLEVTFVSILEDSRCPTDVICIWEGLAKLRLIVHAPELGINKRTIEPTLRAGHPDLGRVKVESVIAELVDLKPDKVSAPPKGQPATPEATVIIGKAP